MPSLKSISSAFCFCLLLTLYAVSAKADTTYTYTGPQFTEFGLAGCPPECNFTGSFTLATPLPPNEDGVAIPANAPFAFGTGPFTATNLSNGPFSISTNAAGAIDGWAIDLFETLADGEVAEIFSGPGEDQLDFGFPNPPNGLKEFFGADTVGTTTSGFWTVSTTGTNVPEPASGTLLIAGLVGLAGLAFKKSL